MPVPLAATGPKSSLLNAAKEANKSAPPKVEEMPAPAAAEPMNNGGGGGQGDDDLLEVPESPAVQKLLREGGNGVTFLDVALSIVDEMQSQLPKTFASQLRFLSECLNGGHDKTKLPIAVARKGETDTNILAIRKQYTKTNINSASLKDAVGKTKSQESAADEAPAKNKEKAKPGAVTGLENWVTPQSRGAMFALSRDKSLVGTASPWMGPVVPRWPVKDMDNTEASALDHMLQTGFNTWNFDLFQFSKIANGRPLQFVAYEALQRSNCFAEFPLDPEKACHFVREAELRYYSEAEVPYHNTLHAADVTQSVHAFLNDVGVDVFFDPMDVLGLVLAAIVHDMGHPGRNNIFLVNAKDNLAITYNDRSVLENFHSAEAFRLLQRDERANFLERLAKDQAAVLRKEMISMVLGTDMTHHFASLGDFKNLASKNLRDVSLWHSEEKSIDAFRIMVLHTSDIGNPANSTTLAQTWSERIVREFFAQGDEEKRMALPVSPLCDRNTTDLASSQLGFIDFIVMPSFSALTELIPRVSDVCISCLSQTREYWERRKNNKDAQAKPAP